MFIDRRKIEAIALRQECHVSRSETARTIVKLPINMALLTECGALPFNGSINIAPLTGWISIAPKRRRGSSAYEETQFVGSPMPIGTRDADNSDNVSMSDLVILHEFSLESFGTSVALMAHQEHDDEFDYLRPRVLE